MKTDHYFIGDNCICWSFGDRISLEISSAVLGVYRQLKQGTRLHELGIRDLVPAYNELAVHFDAVHADVNIIIDQVEQVIERCFSDNNGQSQLLQNSGNTLQIPVDYSGEDLERVATLNNLSVSQVIELHVQAEYIVAMVGFLPHFPYLIGLDTRLGTPRMDSPRTAVPAGSVAIGGAHTGIYPRESPGGWNILGYTDPKLLVSIEPGDTIHFKKVDSP